MPKHRRPLKVLHCYSGNLFGGIETLLLALAHEHDASPMVPEFVLCFEGRLSAELKSAGATVHLLNHVRFSQPWTVVRARHRLSQVLAVSRPDVVVCHECWAHSLCAPVVRRKGVPLVFWMHGVPAGTRWFERLARWTPPDMVLANSHFVAGTVPRPFPGCSYEVLYYPVYPPQADDLAAGRKSVRRELATAEDAVVIIQASRMTPYKGQALLIEALGRIRERSRWVVWMAGGAQQPVEHAYFERLQSAVYTAGMVEHVRFLGDRSDVPRLLAAADIFCQANTGPEPFGIAFIEALYAGLPVVSTRMGGAVEIITDSCGVLVPPDNPDALAAALSGLIDSPLLRARLGAAGPERARSLCDPAARLAHLHDLLAGVAEGSPAMSKLDANTPRLA